MFGVFKGRDQTVVAPTCYLSGNMFLPSSSFFYPSFLPLTVFCHTRVSLSCPTFVGMTALRVHQWGKTLVIYCLLAPSSVFILGGCNLWLFIISTSVHCIGGSILLSVSRMSGDDDVFNDTPNTNWLISLFHHAKCKYYRVRWMHNSHSWLINKQQTTQ